MTKRVLPHVNVIFKIQRRNVTPVLNHGCVPSRLYYMELVSLFLHLWNGDGDNVYFSSGSLEI